MAFKDEYKAAFSSVHPSAEFDPEEIYMKANRKRTPMRRVAAAALAAALLLALSVTAYATELFGLMDFVMPDEYQSSTLPDTVADNASDRQHIAISGFVDSPEAKASAEWKQYYNGFDFTSISYDEDELPQNASYYGAYTTEMYTKLQEIAAKYDLELLGNVTAGSRGGHTLHGTEATFYQYDNGTFKEDCDFIYEKQTFSYSLIRNVKGSLSASSFEIWDADKWTTWSYDTGEGYSVAIGVSDELFDAEGRSIGNRGMILTDLGDCFVTLIMVSWDEPIPPEAMQAAAESLDYARLAEVNK